MVSAKVIEELETRNLGYILGMRIRKLTEVRHNGNAYLLRTPLQSVCGKVFQAVGMAIPLGERRERSWCQDRCSWPVMPLNRTLDSPSVEDEWDCCRRRKELPSKARIRKGR